MLPMKSSLLFLCFVRSSTQTIEERFLAFSECVTGVSGEAIADCILQLLADWQLPATDLHGQTYDGAGAMAGRGRSKCHTALPKGCLHTLCCMFSTSALSTVVLFLKSETPWILPTVFAASLLTPQRGSLPCRDG